MKITTVMTPEIEMLEEGELVEMIMVIENGEDPVHEIEDGSKAHKEIDLLGGLEAEQTARIVIGPTFENDICRAVAH